MKRINNAEFNHTGTQSIKLDGVYIQYGRIPGGLVEGFDDIVFYFQTQFLYNAEKHEAVIRPLINLIESKSYNHGAEWRLNKVEAVTWTEHVQITVASFRVRDIY